MPPISPSQPPAAPTSKETAPADTGSPDAPEGDSLETPAPWRQRIQAIRDKTGIGGHARVDYYSASKRLDDNHSLPGLTFQPKAAPKFGNWGDAKIEGRLTDQDLADRREPQQARLLEAYTNFYFKSFDVRIGKQNIPWGRADALNPTDNLTPKDFTVLSARDEDDRRTGTAAVKANYYRGPYTLSVVWLPLFNPSTIPLTAPQGFLITEEKRNRGRSADQGFAAKLDHTGGDLDWSVSYYYGLDVLPVGMPVTPTQSVLVHNRIHVIGLDFAKPIGRYGLRGEAAYVQTQNPDGKDFFIKNPYFMAVMGVDRDITDDLNVNIQAYHRYIVSFNDPFAIEDPVARSVAVLSDTFNQQLDRIQGGFTGRIKATWLNKTLEGELLGMLNLPRQDFFLRPSLAYAVTDVWKAFVGWDIFNGRRDSFFGRLQPTSAFFVELRATF